VHITLAIQQLFFSLVCFLVFCFVNRQYYIIICCGLKYDRVAKLRDLWTLLWNRLYAALWSTDLTFNGDILVQYLYFISFLLTIKYVDYLRNFTLTRKCEISHVRAVHASESNNKAIKFSSSTVSDCMAVGGNTDLDLCLSGMKSFNSQLAVRERSQRRISYSQFRADEISDAQVSAVADQVATVRRVWDAERRVHVDNWRLVPRLTPAAAAAAWWRLVVLVIHCVIFQQVTGVSQQAKVSSTWLPVAATIYQLTVLTAIRIFISTY